MASDKKAVSGTYDDDVDDSGEGQSKAKFSSYPTGAVTDKLPKSTDKGQGVKTVSEQRSNP